MPKQRITKEMVVEAAFEIARNDGTEQVLVKNIAEKIGCSVQPIYSYCRNMDGLKADVTGRALEFVREFAALCQHRQSVCTACKRGAEYFQAVHPASERRSFIAE